MKNHQILGFFAFALLISLASLSFVSAIYYVNQPTQAGAPGYWVCDSVYQNCEFGVIHECACGTINCDRVNTCESVQAGAKSDTGLLGPAGYSFFLANGYCPSGFQYNSVGFQKAVTCQTTTPTCTNFTYSSWSTCTNTCGLCNQTRTITSSYPSGCSGGSPILTQTINLGNCPINNVTLPTITILSPENKTYTNRTINLIVSSDQPITNWKYNLNGNVNITFTPNTVIMGQDGTNVLKVYGTNVNGTGSATVVFYVNVSGTNPPISTIPIITITSPQSINYNTTNILLNGTSNQIVNWAYNLNNNGNISFIPGNFYNLPPVNGTNIIKFYGTNVNGTGSATVSFNYNSSNVIPTPTCVPNWVCSIWSSCTNGERTRTCNDINSCNNLTGKPTETEDCSEPIKITKKCKNNDTFFELATNEIPVDSAILTPSNSSVILGSQKPSGFDFKTFIYWITIAIVVLLILVLIVYIYRLFGK